MKFASVIGITMIAILMTLYEWPKISKNQKKEKRAFVALTIAGWMLAVLLVYFPDMPGPTQLIQTVFKPLSKFLEQ
ncbi:hypothetical protein [Bacillus sp. B15-48]|uniref:hypothetical protein n=1 Tax=Bacillus sp. B15-48 TaxID=1548601 RepID=UPI00193FFB49|nr:hypothetical protein [Bacillus sp. B15-48]MBM4761099.1 hypothetical protein [Bacillus sp. B15-48]